MDQTLDPPNDSQALGTAFEVTADLACSSLDEIAAMARTALASMERPEFYDSPESVAKVLDAIVRTSETTRDWIGVEGAKIGYAYQDCAAERRQQAMEAARPSWGGGVTKPLQKSKIWIPCRGALLLSCPLERAFLSRRRSVYL